VDERFETRVAVERIENRFNIDPTEVRAVAVDVALFQPAKRFIFVTGSEVDESTVVSQALSVWTHFVELGEGLLRDVFVTPFCFSHGEKGQMQRVAASARRRSLRDSLFLVLAQLSEPRITADRIPSRIEPEERG